MYYSDTLTRGFIEAGTYIPFLGGSNALDKFTAYEDPTYLGFSIRFIDYPVAWGSDGVGEDFMPMSLLYEDKGDAMPWADSAEAYFRRRGEYYRAKMIRQFRQEIISLQSNTPWVFEKITGLAELWKVVPNQAWRSKDKKLVIECSESISLRITHLLDLYRKAMWDSAYNRWAAPDLQRYFALDIVISEVRNMQRVEGVRDDPNKEAAGGLLQALQGIPAANAIINSQVGNSVQNLIDRFTNKDNTTPRATIWNTGTYLRFFCDMCELDPFSDAPTFLDASSTPGDPAKSVKLQIKVGRVREYNVYGLLGAMLAETYDGYSRGKENAAKLISDTGEATPDVLRQSGDLYAYKGLDTSLDYLSQDAARLKAQESRKKSPIGLSNNNSLPVGGGGPSTGNPPNPLIPPSTISGFLPGPLENIVRGVAAEGAALLGSFVDNALGGLGKQERLGNVYDMNPGSLASILGIISNPEAAARNFVSNLAGSAADRNRLGKAEIASGPGVGEVASAISQTSGMQLLDDDGVIGVASFLVESAQNQPQLVKKFLGEVDLLAQQVAGTPLENQSISYIMAAVASGNLQGSPQATALEGTPSNAVAVERVDLQAPSILNTTLGKILLAGSDSAQLEGSPGKVILSAAYVAPEKPDLGKEPLKGRRVNRDLSQESVDLVSPTTSPDELSNIDLEGPSILIEGEPSPLNVGLDSPTPLSPKLGNIELDGDAASPSKPLGNIGLE